MTPPFEPEPNGGRDRRGRFRRGNLFANGAGAAAHKATKLRAKLQAAVTRRVTPTKADAFVDMLYEAATQDRDLTAARILAPYILGRPPEPLSSLQAQAPERIARDMPMDLEAIATTTQQILEAFAAGKLSAADATLARAFVETLLHARQMTDVITQLEQVHQLLEELNERSRHA
jgi:uroporphyrinogen-III decarboxylase